MASSSAHVRRVGVISDTHPSAARSSSSPPRLVLLGASNLTRGISTVVETARLTVGEPDEILVAMGHGRSYGLGSRVFGRTLPSILGCGLWDRLREGDPSSRTYALVSDVGNDIAYGQRPGQILEWVTEVVGRLRASDARVVLSGLPVGTLACMHPAWFACFRTLMFPGRRLTREQAIVRAEEVNAGLEDLARADGTSFVPLRPGWYGFDPIHIKLKHWRAAWAELLGPWTRESRTVATKRDARDELPETLPATRGSLARWVYLRTRRPESMRCFGIPLTRSQPSARLFGATSVSCF